LVLDDLHWSDESSLVLLRLLARSITGWPVLLVGTYRQTERLPAALGELAGDVTRTIHLREMPREDVARLIEVTADATLGPDLVDAIWRETEGNPLFVIEIVRLLVAETPIVKHGQDRKQRLPVPDSIRHVIRRRVDQLGAECGRALEVAAVAGNDFDLIIIEGPLGLPRPRLIEVLEEARAAGMVADQPGTRGAYAFSHPLLRETIYENVPISRRMQLHLRLGEAMEMLLPIDPNPCLGELAYHFCQGAPIGDAGRGIRYSIEAGDRAIEVGAFEEAADYTSEV
jgi:predicted ATPase